MSNRERNYAEKVGEAGIRRGENKVDKRSDKEYLREKR